MEFTFTKVIRGAKVFDKAWLTTTHVSIHEILAETIFCCILTAISVLIKLDW